ncbi:MAG: FtsX-like permease family protein, partial [Bacteroidota bacterium]
LVIRFRRGGQDILVRVNSNNITSTINEMEKVYQKFNPGYAFNYSFMDEEYQALYEAESRIAILSKYFTALAIIISCLGLLGLAIFTTERKKKELSIRKVLGASIPQLIHLLSKDFAQMILIAIVIALPLSYLVAIKWLNNFAYKTDLEWWLFAVAAGSIFLITYLTLSLQSIKAAFANPVNHLKHEG